PAFIGQGMGRYFLQWTIEKAWPLGNVLERHRLHDDAFILPAASSANRSDAATAFKSALPGFSGASLMTSSVRRPSSGGNVLRASGDSSRLVSAKVLACAHTCDADVATGRVDAGSWWACPP